MKQLEVNGMLIPVLSLAVLVTDSGKVSHTEVTPLQCYKRIKELTDCSHNFARSAITDATQLDINGTLAIVIQTQGIELELSRLA